MSLLKITYGIDLGTTNSAITRFENGRAVVKKNSLQSDTTPSCVSYPRPGRVLVGARARTQLEKDYVMAFKKEDYVPCTFIEFKRLMGTDYVYHCRNYEGTLTPEVLSAEVLKSLRKDVLDDNVTAAVITVPAMFTDTQRNATKEAAKLAGFDHVELIQEPVAASVAYGLDSKMKDAYWVVFDFGGGTFDAALMRIQDGVMQAVDTAGNNKLGGKDIDTAIINEIFIPYFKQNFTIDRILATKGSSFRNMWKAKAEEAKISLSFNNCVEVETDLGEDYGIDDNGEELSLAITISREQFQAVAAPIFQKAIDITKELLRRNNLKGSDLGALILVGGPTHSPVLRQMLRDQITPNVDVSIDPMTCVAAGAAIYGSTIDLPDEVIDNKRDRSKIQLEVKYQSTSADPEEWVSVSLLADKCDGFDGNEVEVEFARTDGMFTSPKALINDIGDVVCLPLKESATNVFDIRCYDLDGTPMECEPNQISIIHGIVIDNSILPKAIGVGAINDKNVEVFIPAHGLEKNRKVPSTGTISGLHTLKDIRAGVESDEVRITIYQIDEAIEDARVLYCERQYDIVFTGDDLPSTLPEGSPVSISMHADKSGTIDNFQVELPDGLVLDLTDRVTMSRTSAPSESYLIQEINACRRSAQELQDTVIINRLNVLEQRYLADKDNRDNAEATLSELQSIGREIDKKLSMGEWDREVKKLRGMYEELCNDNRKYGNAETTRIIETLKSQMESVIAKGDVQLVKDLYQQMWNLDYRIAEVEFYIAWISQWDREFRMRNWSNPSRARDLINRGLRIIQTNPTAVELKPIAFEIMDLLPENQRPTDSLGR